jgi:hypothetical protein
MNRICGLSLSGSISKIRLAAPSPLIPAAPSSALFCIWILRVIRMIRMMAPAIRKSGHAVRNAKNAASVC